MHYIKSFILFVFFIIAGTALYALTGTVKNNMGETVDSARIHFILLNDTSVHYTYYTDSNGNYQADIETIRVIYGENEKVVLYRNYPNPFNNSMLIPFMLTEDGRVNIVIYDLYGKFIKVVLDKNLEKGLYQASWDGKNAWGTDVSPGVYFFKLVFNNEFVLAGKMIRVAKAANAAAGAIPFHNLQIDTFTNYYKVIITKDGYDTMVMTDLSFSGKDTMNFLLFLNTKVPFACQKDYFGIWDGKKYKKIFIKGVNLGVALPGTQPGELSATREHYARWIARIAELGFNCIRVYTLHYPRFYEELYKYNFNHPEKPLYLFQGVWLDEDVQTGNLFELTEAFDNEIEENVDCVHGNRTIDERQGKAFGTYTADVSRWVIGIIPGREMHPYEVVPTDTINSSINGFSGKALKLLYGTPTESWLSARLDHLIMYERNNYQVERPVSISSWPTLDPIQHEPDTLTDEDVATVDLSDLITTDAPAGYFATYHAYPYYPDFVNNDSKYLAYSDIVGPNPYLGYLQDLKDHYRNKPLLIGEFGVPSSWGSAHSALSGMNHGGHTEVMQGVHDARLLGNIYDNKCAGGCLFSWMDEWFKITWITNPIGTVPSRRHLWHNVTSPEQNFGLVTFDAADPTFSNLNFYNAHCKVDNLEVATANDFFHFRITLHDSIQAGDTILVALDTYKPGLGESLLPDSHVVSNRAEFLLKIIPPDTADLYVMRAYDLFAIWFGWIWVEPYQLYHSTVSDSGFWNLVRWKNNFPDSSVQDIGRLHARWEADSNKASNLDAVIFSGKTIDVRIPWTLLNVVDPSNLEVMDDDRNTPQRETATTDGISLSVIYKGCMIISDRYLWKPWNGPPPTVEREKPAMEIFSKALKTFPDFIK